MRSVILLVFFLTGFNSYSSVVIDTLYINRGTDTLFSQQYHFIAFNSSPVFTRTNTSFRLSTNDTLQLVLINTDTLSHDFTIDTILTSGNTVAPNDTITIAFCLTISGTYRFYSSVSGGHQLGASGIITSGYQGYKTYQWNLYDADSSFSRQFNEGLATWIDDSFKPSLYSINGKYYPQTAFDSTSLITGMIGDTIIISVLNSGHMLHAMHFHGFHVKILNASHVPQMNGWIKDSFPVHEGAVFTLMMIPDKEGMYPVHDHNLIASTNAGMYPGGMMAMIDIMP